MITKVVVEISLLFPLITNKLNNSSITSFIYYCYNYTSFRVIPNYLTRLTRQLLDLLSLTELNSANFFPIAQ